ncbi:MAG: ABC transporter ATP-binding protein [Dehalococcoidales bacterium]|nr:ABC transporter ATP-binding protein [Dehalococcoidales bacterium]
MFLTAIRIENLKKHFGSVKAVDGISIEVGKGALFGFLGPNGAGKTTTIRCMMNFIHPLEGSVSILGKDAQNDYVELKKRIGYLSGSTQLYRNWDGQTHIDYIRRFDGADDIAQNLIRRFNLNVKTKVKYLSSGNIQKLGIVLAFMKKPEVLILDEPTRALDPLLQNEVYELLQEFAANGSTIFMSSHNLAEVERICSQAGIIKNGKMVALQSISALKEKRLNLVDVRFEQPVSKECFTDENTEVLKEFADGFLLKVKGDITPVIVRLADCRIAHITISQPSLEDIFMEYYSEGGDD